MEYRSESHLCTPQASDWSGTGPEDYYGKLNSEKSFYYWVINKNVDRPLILVVLLSTAICKDETFLHLTNLLAVISFIYFLVPHIEYVLGKQEHFMPCETRVVVRFFPRGFKGMHEGYLFLKLWHVWSPTHSCKVQWDCCLIPVQLSDQIRKSFADKGTHQNKWLMKGRALFPFLWNTAYSILSISLCVFPNQSKFCQQKWQRLTDFYPLKNQEICLDKLSPRLTP